LTALSPNELELRNHDIFPQTQINETISSLTVLSLLLLLLWSTAIWQVYDKLFCQLLLSSAPLTVLP